MGDRNESLLKTLEDAVNEAVMNNQSALLLLERDELREKLERAEKKVANLHERLSKHTAREKRLGKEIERLNWLLGCRKREISELSARAMPDGYRWPKFEDGEPVLFGDETDKTEAVESITFDVGGTTLIGDKHGDFAIEHGERVKRPQVIAADGEPLEAGQTVYLTFNDEQVTVKKIENGMVWYSYGSGPDVWSVPENITHQRPVLDADGVIIRKGDTVWHVQNGREYVVVEPSYGDTVVVRDARYHHAEGEQYAPDKLTHTKPEQDSWERIEDDAKNIWSKPIPFGKDAESTFTCRVFDLVRRCKALSGVDE